MADINKARQAINEIDNEMRILFEKRMDAAKEVAEYKKERGLQIYDAAREAEIIKNGGEKIENPEYETYYKNFLEGVMKISKQYQSRIIEGMKVAYSGVEGAFAYITAKRAFPTATPIGYKDFKSAYNAVLKGECDCAILPVENSHNGDVGQVMDLAFFGELKINGLYEIKIVQNLLGIEGATIDDIKTVISHPQAIGQCHDYIERHGLIAEEAVNTAVAAKKVAEMKDKSFAAIGSIEAGEIYGLKKIEAHINEKSENTTRFAVFSPKSNVGEKHFVMTFTVQNEAGSLGKAIEVIGKYGFNLRALKSRPTKELSWSYYFYAEADGNINSDIGKLMLNELSKCCNSINVLGSFNDEIMLEEPK